MYGALGYAKSTNTAVHNRSCRELVRRHAIFVSILDNKHVKCSMSHLIIQHYRSKSLLEANESIIDFRLKQEHMTR
jgi:hypothetical protein